MDDLRIIKVYEDRQIKLQLTEQEINDILLIRDIIGENNLNLQADGKLLVSHYVGFVQVKKTRLLIYPKIARNVQDEASYRKAFDVLVKMLSYSGFDQIKRISTPQRLSRFDGDILELFIGIFADELLSLFKRDINRSYRRTIENQSFIKGKIDFAENIKSNSFRNHIHAVRFEEFTEDILMNQIFKTVVAHLLKKTTLRDNRLKLSQALLWLEDVEQIKLTSDIWNKVVFTRLNHQYETVFNMAKLFYQNSSLNLNKGDELTFSFLVPLNQLFEKYVYEILKNSMRQGVNVKYQGPIRYLGNANGERLFQLKPDISLVKDDQVIMIVDAKYKEVLDAEGGALISQSDIYQMLAYSVRYSCNQIILAYPKMIGECRKDFQLLNVEIPLEDSILTVKAVQIDLECDTSTLIERLTHSNLFHNQDLIINVV